MQKIFWDNFLDFFTIYILEEKQMNRDALKAMILEQLKGAAVQRVMESKYKTHKEKHGEVGSKYIDTKGVEHDEPYEEPRDQKPEDFGMKDDEEIQEELELELEE